jgi:hypothetical protein
MFSSFTSGFFVLPPIVADTFGPPIDHRQARYLAGRGQLTSPSGQFDSFSSSAVRARVMRAAHCQLTMPCTLPPCAALLSSLQAATR